MTGLTMQDTAWNDQFTAGADAYAAYVDGGVGNQPNYDYIVRTFPKAHHLSIALFASDDADALDVEPGAANPGDIPGWYARQRARGVARPCIYANASTMEAQIVPIVQALPGFVRSQVRLWSAHYGASAHICGPNSCGAVSIDVDGTQWTDVAMGRNLDQSLLLANFFDTPPKPKPKEDDVQSGQLNNGPQAVTIINVPRGSGRNVAFGCDNGVQGKPPAKLRVAIYDTAWHADDHVIVDSTKGQTVIPFGDPGKTGVISVRREDAGDVVVGWEVS